MSEKNKLRGWPPEVSQLEKLSEVNPPADLEQQVVQELLDQKLIRSERLGDTTSLGWLTMRASLATAACIAFLAIGVLIGRSAVFGPSLPTAVLTGAETDLYALLLFETAGYNPPNLSERIERFDEYSKWVAKARARGQFVTGEDLEVDRGWAVFSSDGALTTELSVSIDGAPLSGMFFIRAKDENHALEIARELPHVRHGGTVLVQKTIPTNVPPSDSIQSPQRGQL